MDQQSDTCTTASFTPYSAGTQQPGKLVNQTGRRLLDHKSSSGLGAGEICDFDQLMGVEDTSLREHDCNSLVEQEVVSTANDSTAMMDFEFDLAFSMAHAGRSSAVKQDRFIANNAKDSQTKNFQQKSLVFSADKLESTSTPFEAGLASATRGDLSRFINSDQSARPGNTGSSQSATAHPACEQSQNNQIYQTLLQARLLNAENPHTLRNGALNDEMSDENTLLHTIQTTTKYNALDFSIGKSSHSKITSPEDRQLSEWVYSGYTPEPSLTQQREEERRETFSDENQACLPPYCGIEEQDLLTTKYTRQRNISKTPFKVLDAPCLIDDFYLNLVDWSEQNVLAVGLGSSVYLWSATNSKVTKLSDIGPDNRVTSVQWSRDGHLFAVGTHSGDL